MKEPLLSICIPAYNREKYLKRLLDSIVCQKEFTNTDDVEIVVDDGPSTDNTESLVKDYIKKYGDKVKYYRNSIKIGMCPAFLEALNLGTGKYLWLMGSDDFMYKKSLSCFMESIKKAPKLILSTRIETKFGNGDENSIKDSGNNIMNVSTSELFDLLGKNELSYYDKTNFFTFISVFCFEKKHYQESYEYLMKKFDNKILNQHYFNFSLIGLSNLKESDFVSIIKLPHLIICESGNHGWKANKKISGDLYHLTNFIKSNYPLTFSCKMFFKKMNFLWRLNCNIVPYISRFLKKIGLFNPILKLYKKIFY